MQVTIHRPSRFGFLGDGSSLVCGTYTRPPGYEPWPYEKVGKDNFYKSEAARIYQAVRAYIDTDLEGVIARMDKRGIPENLLGAIRDRILALRGRVQDEYDYQPKNKPPTKEDKVLFDMSLLRLSNTDVNFCPYIKKGKEHEETARGIGRDLKELRANFPLPGGEQKDAKGKDDKDKSGLNLYLLGGLGLVILYARLKSALRR